jgi:hypothetical protein
MFGQGGSQKPCGGQTELTLFHSLIKIEGFALKLRPSFACGRSAI